MYSETSEYPATGIWIGVIQELENRNRVGVLGLSRGLQYVPCVTVTTGVQMFSANQKGKVANVGRGHVQRMEIGRMTHGMTLRQFCMDKFSLVRPAIHSNTLARNLLAEVLAEEPDP